MEFERSYEKEGILLAGATVDDITATAADLEVDASPLFS